jgi:hypothetical protein
LAKALACCILCFVLALPARADGARSRIILIVFDGLTLSDLERPELTHLRSLVQNGQVALMNTAVAGPRTPLAATLTLALGALAPAEPTDSEIYESREIVERTDAANVYRRRIGPLPKSIYNRGVDITMPLVHIGWAPIMRRGLDHRLIGAVIAKAGARRFLPILDGPYEGSQGREIALFAVDSRGIGASGSLNNFTKDSTDQRLERFLRTTSENLAYNIASGGGDRRALSLLDQFLGKLDRFGTLKTTRVMLVSAYPAPAADGAWDRLSVAVFAGPGLAPGLLSSPTTRTPGLIANVDIAPTLLSWLDVPKPYEMTGQAIPMAPAAPHSLEALRNMDRIAQVNGRALIPLFIALGAFAAVVAFSGLLLVHLRRSAILPALGVQALMAMPLALFFAEGAARSVLSLGAATGVAMVVLGLGAYIAARMMDRPALAPVVIAALTAVVVVTDAFFGHPLVKFSALSGYQLQGIRFYGIGNEHMGVLIGYALLVACLLPLPRAIAAAWYLLVAFVIGWPGLGANAGGLVAATVAFTAGWAKLGGRRAGPGLFFMSSLLGLALAFLVAYLDSHVAGAGASHLGGALSTAKRSGWQVLWEIAQRKAAMNARIMTHPAVLAAVFGLSLLWAAVGGSRWDPWGELSRRNRSWADGLVAAGWGALAALLFNDSGIVAALLLMGTILATGAYLLFAQSLSTETDAARVSGKLPPETSNARTPESPNA